MNGFCQFVNNWVEKFVCVSSHNVLELYNVLVRARLATKKELDIFYDKYEM